MSLHPYYTYIKPVFYSSATVYSEEFQRLLYAASPLQSTVKNSKDYFESSFELEHEDGVIAEDAETGVAIVAAIVKLRAQTPQSNITTGSTLYTNSSPNFWPSPSGHFAFGFYPTGNGFKAGIWLIGSGPANDIIDVWTARRTDPVVSSGAALQFSVDGSRVLLRNSNGEVQLIAEPTRTAVAAAMLDSGNFVLCDSSSQTVWASFDHPTDTLLVSQKLAKDSELYSSMSLTNQSIGNFKLLMQSDGNLNAFPLRSIQDGKYGYWSSYTSGAGHNVTLNLDQYGILYLGNSTGLYQHQIGTSGSFSSKILWVAIVDEDRCVVKGACGLNSYCSLNGTGIACFCPPGFIYIDPEKPQEGCKLNSTIEDCLE
ncbi:G-type lectin S-receptor-like serine/threonine-protein kinase LECRK1 [Citrus sinensis]|uniref:G-type lectin S-receptor-like serine/threonine-protein kinase LECRK1 n=1 Tax=Citrus sinensis TaxID=2711 RepID=UPI002277B5BA|nr:G-type lectin S-receptor-like serine/threonine-protein kinase LECRK1 [Citrus sinensis]